MDQEAHTLLAQLLNSRIDFHQLRYESFAAGYIAPSQVVPSCRFILITAGEVEYAIEQQTMVYGAGSALFVPPWVWRKWQVAGQEPLELLWTVFTPGERIFNTLDHILVDQPADFDLLTDGLKRMLELWPDDAPERLLLEGEFKAVLARFFSRLPAQAAQAPTSERHPEVVYAIHWLQAHYATPSALSELQQQLKLNPDYFRNLFRQEVHQSPNQYLTMLRMRAARFYLSEGSGSIKEIAARTGFPDPLYFSRAYRKFWGSPPSKHQR